MLYLTFEQLRQYPLSLHRPPAAFVENTRAHSPKKSIFLSHSNLDRNLLPHAKSIFKDHGREVWVDVDDVVLRGLPGGKAASYLRERIGESSHLIVLVTSNLSSSRWIPWELGFGDGVRTRAKIGLLPIIQDAASGWPAEREYFSIYNVIEVASATTTRLEFRVRTPSGRRQTLGEWLR